ncbi:MAG: prevent-host-death family protein [Chlamydiales bacterium]
MSWKLAEAKNKFSEVVRRALQEGPQRIERRKDAVVLVSAAEFDRLVGKKPDFIEFLLGAPDMGDLDLDRDRTPMRDLDL